MDTSYYWQRHRCRLWSISIATEYDWVPQVELALLLRVASAAAQNGAFQRRVRPESPTAASERRQGSVIWTRIQGVPDGKQLHNVAPPNSPQLWTF